MPSKYKERRRLLQRATQLEAKGEKGEAAANHIKELIVHGAGRHSQSSLVASLKQSGYTGIFKPAKPQANASVASQPVPEDMKHDAKREITLPVIPSLTVSDAIAQHVVQKYLQLVTGISPQRATQQSITILFNFFTQKMLSPIRSGSSDADDVTVKLIGSHVIQHAKNFKPEQANIYKINPTNPLATGMRFLSVQALLPDEHKYAIASMVMARVLNEIIQNIKTLKPDQPVLFELSNQPYPDVADIIMALQESHLQANVLLWEGLSQEEISGLLASIHNVTVSLADFPVITQYLKDHEFERAAKEALTHSVEASKQLTNYLVASLNSLNTALNAIKDKVDSEDNTTSSSFTR